MKHRVQRFSLALVLCALAPGLTAQSLQVVRADGTSTTLTAAQIAALPQVTVNVRDHDKPASFQAFPGRPCFPSPECSLGPGCAVHA